MESTGGWRCINVQVDGAFEQTARKSQAGSRGTDSLSLLFLKVVTDPDRVTDLLEPQRLHGIDGRGSPRRQVTRQHGHARDTERRQHHSRQVRGPDAE